MFGRCSEMNVLLKECGSSCVVYDLRIDFGLTGTMMDRPLVVMNDVREL